LRPDGKPGILPVQASVAFGPEQGVGAGYGAPDQALGPLEEAGPVEQGVPDADGDAVVGVVGALVMDVVVLLGEDQVLKLPIVILPPLASPSPLLSPRSSR
jgi:hypothetical protein